MKIPNKVKVGGVFYTVRCCEATCLNDENFGVTVPENSEIILLNSERQNMERTFVHEVLHALLFDLGYNDHDEETVDRLAGALYALIVDNPIIFVTESKKSFDRLFLRKARKKIE